VELFLKNLSEGTNLTLAKIVDLLNFVNSFNISLIKINRLMRIGLATNSPCKEGAISSSSVKGGS
jgi:hypothetical protein